ncbi:MAG: DNA-deoxyinosine glycosylase [Phocaeicola sp.]
MTPINQSPISESYLDENLLTENLLTDANLIGFKRTDSKQTDSHLDKNLLTDSTLTDSHFKESFQPLLCPEPHYLILGSIPGDRSIAEQAYYAHPQNRFWRVIATLCRAQLPVHYPARIALLAAHHIALWDVAHTAHRKGSLDSAIRNEAPNAIHQLLEAHPTIHTVLFNGKKAEQLYRRYFNALPHLRYFSLPSTSPANAACHFDRLVEHWGEAWKDDSYPPLG